MRRPTSGYGPHPGRGTRARRARGRGKSLVVGRPMSSRPECRVARGQPLQPSGSREERLVRAQQARKLRRDCVGHDFDLGALLLVHQDLSGPFSPFQSTSAMCPNISGGGRLASSLICSRRWVVVSEPAQASITKLAVRLGLALETEQSGNRVARTAPSEVVRSWRRGALWCCERCGMPWITRITRGRCSGS